MFHPHYILERPLCITPCTAPKLDVNSHPISRISSGKLHASVGEVRWKNCVWLSCRIPRFNTRGFSALSISSRGVPSQRSTKATPMEGDNSHQKEKEEAEAEEDKEKMAEEDKGPGAILESHTQRCWSSGILKRHGSGTFTSTHVLFLPSL